MRVSEERVVCLIRGLPTWRASKELDLGGAHLPLQIAKRGPVLVARHGLHVPDGRHDALLPPFFGLHALALAHAQQAVLVAGNGQVVHAPDLAHARLVGDAVDDERLGADPLQLVLGPAHVLHQALLARVLLLLGAETAGLAGHAVVEARQVGGDDGVARVGERVDGGLVLACEGRARVEGGLGEGGFGGLLQLLLVHGVQLALGDAVGVHLGELLRGDAGDARVALVLVGFSQRQLAGDGAGVQLVRVVRHGVDLGQVVFVRHPPRVCPLRGLRVEVAGVNGRLGRLDGGNLGGRVLLLQQADLARVVLGVLGRGQLVQLLQLLGLDRGIVRPSPAGCSGRRRVEGALRRRLGEGTRRRFGEEASRRPADAHCAGAVPVEANGAVRGLRGLRGLRGVEAESCARCNACPARGLLQLGPPLKNG